MHVMYFLQHICHCVWSGFDAVWIISSAVLYLHLKCSCFVGQHSQFLRCFHYIKQTNKQSNSMKPTQYNATIWARPYSQRSFFLLYIPPPDPLNMIQKTCCQFDICASTANIGFPQISLNSACLQLFVLIGSENYSAISGLFHDGLDKSQILAAAKKILRGHNRWLSCLGPWSLVRSDYDCEDCD